MSYIRSLSNPEGLYIFGNLQGTVEIYHDGPISKTMPLEIFEGLCKAYFDNFGECTEYEGASIGEEKRDGHFKYVLRYENWEVEMWFVTWSYIARRFDRCRTCQSRLEG